MSVPRVAILISGGGSNMDTLIADMHAEGYADPVMVLSNRPDAGGLAKASARGVRAEVIDHKGFDSREAFDAALSDRLTQVAPDAICLAGFMRILTPGFISDWDGKMLNVHPSLLPKHKGLHTHARAIAAGDAEHGVSVHVVTPDLDAGPVLGQARLRIRPDDTPDTLAARVLPLEHRLYPAVLRRFLAGETDVLQLVAE